MLLPYDNRYLQVRLGIFFLPYKIPQLYLLNVVLTFSSLTMSS